MLAQESNKNSRRSFIGTTVKAAMVTALTGSQLNALASTNKVLPILAPVGTLSMYPEQKPQKIVDGL